MNWDDLRIALAIRRHGTLSAAARALAVNQTTVARRLARLERTLGVQLFDRIDGRMVARPAGERALEHAARMEVDALAVRHGLAHADALLEGTVRLTGLPSFLSRFLAPRLGAFTGRYPNIVVELVSSSSNLNLSRREPDLAVRLARPTSGTVLTKRIGTLGFAAYAADGHGPSADAVSGLRDLPWACYDDGLSHLPEARWLEETVRPLRRMATATDVLTLLELVRSGAAVAVLPCFVGDAESNLRRLTGPRPVVEREMWLLTHPDLKRVQRVRLFSDWLQDMVAEAHGVLTGHRLAAPPVGGDTRQRPRGT